MTGMCCVR